MNKITKVEYGIEYELPKVLLMQDTGIGTAEVAARTCYDSFESSENEAIKNMNDLISGDYDSNPGKDIMLKNTIHDIHDIEHSNLLDDLAWTYFHHSILEHANLTYLIRGTSRGVLQELVRHRIASPSVRSTRYTMSSILNAFVASLLDDNQVKFFTDKILKLDVFNVQGNIALLEIEQLFNKLNLQFTTLGKEEFMELAIAKSSLDYVINIKDSTTLFNILEKGKKKRNVGDAFKWIVTDNWKVDLVITMNLRSLKNFLVLRDSGAAYFQIRWLAQEIKKATPSKYLDLIIKGNKNDNNI